MVSILFYFIIPLVFCSSDYQLIRIWMKDVSSVITHGVTDDSLFLSVDLNVPKLMSPDFKYAINDVVEGQVSHKYLKNDDDFRIYGNRHWNQQLFRFFPEEGLILSERFPKMALNVVNEYLQLVERKSIPFNWKWKIRESSFESLYELRHSHFELEHFLIDYFNTGLNLTNGTHIAANDIEPEFVNSIAGNIKKNESKPTETRQNFAEIQTIKEQKEREKENKKSSIGIWAFISVTVILIIMGLFMKTGCFSKCATGNQRSNLERESTSNLNN